MSLLGVRCVSCLAFALAALSMAWALNAHAADVLSGSVGGVSNEFWLGLFFSVVFSLTAAYMKGMERGFEKRIASLEFDYRQHGSELSLLRNTMLQQYPTKEETAEHRDRVEAELRYIRQRVDEALRSRGHG